MRKIKEGGPEWKKSLAEALLCHCGDLVTCRHCGRVLLAEYCCTYCGSTDPGENAVDMWPLEVTVK